jgi:hypothetical protein
MCAAERAVVPVCEAATAAMASGIDKASTGMSGEPRLLELLQKMSAKMTHGLEEAKKTAHGCTWGREDDSEDEILAELLVSSDISMDATSSITRALRQIAGNVRAAAAALATQNARLEHVSAASTRMANTAAKIETGDWETVRAWLKDEPLAKEFPRSYLARELLRDLVKQLSRKLDFQIPKVLGDQQAKDLLADVLLHGQTTSALSKDHVAQMSAVASAAAQEAEKDMEASSVAAAAVGLQVSHPTRVYSMQGVFRHVAYASMPCAVLRRRSHV